MTQSHNPPSECPRLGGAGPTHKALRTVRSTAVSGMWVNGTCLCDPFSKATDVEWSLERTGLQDSGMNYLETTHSVESLTFQNILDNNEIPKVRQLIHSHPNGHNYPSEKDLDAQKRVNERLQNDNITYLIYTPLNNGGSYYGY